MEDEPFQVPLPPPPFPPPGDRDVVFFRRNVIGPEGREEREDEDIMLRRVPRPVAQKYRAAAGGRAMTHAQYLAALVALHEEVRRRADGGDAELSRLLEELRLASVTV